MFVSAYINTISCPPFQTSFHHNLKFIKTRGIHTLASRHFSPNSKHITQYIRTHSKVVSAIRSCGALPSDYLPLGHSVAGAWDDLWLFAYVYIPIGSVQAYRGSGWLASCAEGAPSDGFGDSVIRATTALIQSTFSHSVTLIRPDCCLRGHTRHFAREKFWAYVGASYLCNYFHAIKKKVYKAHPWKSFAFSLHTYFTAKSTVNIHCSLVLWETRNFPQRLGMGKLEHICPRLRKSK